MFIDCNRSLRFFFLSPRTSPQALTAFYDSIMFDMHATRDEDLQQQWNSQATQMTCLTAHEYCWRPQQ